MPAEVIPQQLMTYARLAYARRLVGGTGGNFSARLGKDKMLITASGISLGDTRLENLITVDIATCQWEPQGELIPSKEYHFHADILRLRPEIGAVLHVHPPYATAYAVKKLDIPMLTDAAFKQPPMPRVPFAPSGSEDLRRFVSQHSGPGQGRGLGFQYRRPDGGAGLDCLPGERPLDGCE
jgi:L-fuculose-phosphate aldolase